MIPLLQFIDVVLLNLLWWVVVISAILSWLIAFGIINSYNEFTSSVMSFLHAVTEPLLRPIRNFVAPINGIDLSPLILLLIIAFLQLVVIRGWLIPFAASAGI